VYSCGRFDDSTGAGCISLCIARVFPPTRCAFGALVQHRVARCVDCVGIAIRLLPPRTRSRRVLVARDPRVVLEAPRAPEVCLRRLCELVRADGSRAVVCRALALAGPRNASSLFPCFSWAHPYTVQQNVAHFFTCLGAALRLAQPEHRVLLEDWGRAQADDKLFNHPTRFLSRAQTPRILISGTLLRAFASRILGTCSFSKDFSMGLDGLEISSILCLFSCSHVETRSIA